MSAAPELLQRRNISNLQSSVIKTRPLRFRVSAYVALAPWPTVQGFDEQHRLLESQAHRAEEVDPKLTGSTSGRYG